SREALLHCNLCRDIDVAKIGCGRSIRRSEIFAGIKQAGAVSQKYLHLVKPTLKRGKDFPSRSKPYKLSESTLEPRTAWKCRFDEPHVTGRIQTGQTMVRGGGVSISASSSLMLWSVW